jgi:hypothetical protein
MNLKKLSKEKRQQLVLVAMLTLMALSGLGFGLIRSQYASVKQLAQNKVASDKRLQDMQTSIRNAGRLEAELTQARADLTEAETDLASGDKYSWIINLLRQFKSGYRIDLPQFSPIGPETEVTMLPGFPYKQVSLTAAGTGRFHEIGRFLADFENRYPHIRLLNLTLEPNPSPAPEDQETLSFKLDIVTLVKAGP